MSKMAVRVDISTAAQGRLPFTCPRSKNIGLKVSRPSASAKARSTSSISEESLGKVRPAYVPNEISDPNYVRIFDTTLRDGEQSPGASLSGKEKLSIARQLAKLRVDIIEAGFPRTSPADFEAVKSIAEEIGQDLTSDGYTPVICGLSRANVEDIDASWNAVKHAIRPRIHTFIGTSPIHMKAKLRKTPEQVVKTAIEAVSYARSLGCSDIEFSPEDAGRSDPEFLYYILGEVIKAGATTINIPDTVGYNIPGEYGQLIKNIKENTPGADKVVISTHCQNDLGLASANTLAGALAGARQVEVTINGIGERAGNASLEEVVMAIKMRGEGAMEGLWTGLDIATIGPISKMVSEYTGMSIQPHKAIVGANAFAHESGIHQDGMLKDKSTYEIMSPEDLGLMRKDTVGLVIGKHSGRHALKSRMQELGYELNGDEVNDLFKRFKELADRKKMIRDDDLIALVDDEMFNTEEHWKLCDLQVVAGTTSLQNAVVSMVGPDNVTRIQSAMGAGPVDATYKAIDKIVQLDAQLVEYGMSAVTEGIDALAQTRVMIRKNGKSFIGKSAESDIVLSSAKAYVSALNKFIAAADSNPRTVRENRVENGQSLG